MSEEYLIVSRHPAAIAFVRQTDERFADAPALPAVTAEQVRGKKVAGNLPLHLAVHALSVTAVEFKGDAPRGHEYTLEEMEAHGATLVEYSVCLKEHWEALTEVALSGYAQLVNDMMDTSYELDLRKDYLNIIQIQQMLADISNGTIR